MERAALRELVVEQLCKIAPDIEPDEVPDDEDLRDALDLDSMDFMRLLTALDKQLGISIPESDTRKVLELDALLDYLLAKGA